MACCTFENSIKHTSDILTGLLIVAAPLLYYFSPVFSQEMILSATGLIVFATLVVVVSLQKPRSVRALSVVDLAVAVYLLYSLLNALLVSRSQVDYFIWLKWISLAGLYILIRNTGNKNKLFYYFAIAGVLQSLIAVAQQTGIITKPYTLWNITGSFGNPGHLGGFLCICFVVTLCLLLRNGKNIRLWSASIIQIGGLLLADSRAAVAGIVAGAMLAVVLYFPRYIKRHRKYIIAAGVIILVAGSAFLYNYRKGSADGRLFIWRVSADMIADKPLLGHGVGRFAYEYMPYQARYFEQHRDSKYVMVADEVALAFNEFIHITTEQGAVGLLLFGFILFSIFWSGNNVIAKSGIAAWCGFALFSYPAEIFPIMALFSVLLACVDGEAVFRFNRRRALSVIAAAVSAVLCIVCFTEIRRVQCTEKLLRNGDLAALEQQFERYKYNVVFNSLYFRHYAERPVDLIDLDRVPLARSCCEGFCAVGKLYERLGMYRNAENYYIAASNMIPNRIAPKYSLWELYTRTGQASDAHRIAWEIIRQPVKVEGTYAIRIKSRMRRYLEEK